MAGACECGEEPPGSIKRGELFYTCYTKFIAESSKFL